MKQQLSEREVKLQTKYFMPVNIIVCVISLVAFFTLLFAPLLYIDVGEILHDKNTVKYLDDAISESFDAPSEGGDSVDYSPVVKKIVNKLLSDVDCSLSFSTAGAMKVAFSSGDDKSKTAMDDLLYGESGAVNELISSIVDAVFDLFKSKDGKKLITEAVVTTMVSAIVSETNTKLSDKEIRDLTNTLNKLATDDVNTVVDEFANQLSGFVGDDMTGQMAEDIKDIIKDVHEKAQGKLDEGENVTLENLVCAAISSGVDLGDFNISELIGGVFGDNGNNNGVNNEPDDRYEGPYYDQIVLNESENNDGEENGNVVVTFDELMSEMGFDAQKRDELKKELKTTLRKSLDDNISDYTEYFSYYEYVFYVMLVFLILWLLQFIFALVHIFKPDKRFRMWYTKAFCWIPALIWLVLMIAPAILKSAGGIDSSEGIVTAILGGVGSYTWISGLLCVLLIWGCSIAMHVLKKKVRAQLALADGSDASNGDNSAEGEPSAEAAASADLSSGDAKVDLDIDERVKEGDYGEPENQPKEEAAQDETAEAPKCPACGAAVEAGAATCSNCGASLK